MPGGREPQYRGAAVTAGHGHQVQCQSSWGVVAPVCVQSQGTRHTDADRVHRISLGLESGPIWVTGLVLCHLLDDLE